MFCVDLECAVPVTRGTLDPGKERLASKPCQDNHYHGPPSCPPSCREGSWLLAGLSRALPPSCSPVLWRPRSGLSRGMDLGTRAFSRFAFIAAAVPPAFATWLIVVIKFEIRALRDEVCTLSRSSGGRSAPPRWRRRSRGSRSLSACGQRAEWEPEVGPNSEASRPASYDVFPPARLHLPEVSHPSKTVLPA